MAKIYMLRHQRAGIVTSHAFTSPPTAKQQAPIIAECERLHGREGWVKVHEVDLLTNELPSFPERVSGPASISTPQINAVGTVEAK